MQRRVYAPVVNKNKLFDLTDEQKVISKKIIHQKPFQTPNNASKRLLDVIKKIELKYALNHQNSDEYDDYDCQKGYKNNYQSDDYDEQVNSLNGQQSDEYDSYDEFNSSYCKSIANVPPDDSYHLHDEDDIWFLDSPRCDQEFINPHQSRLNHQFQRITRNQEKVKIEIQNIKKIIENLDNEYELMDNILDLSF